MDDLSSVVYIIADTILCFSSSLSLFSENCIEAIRPVLLSASEISLQFKSSIK